MLLSIEYFSSTNPLFYSFFLNLLEMTDSSREKLESILDVVIQDVAKILQDIGLMQQAIDRVVLVSTNSRCHLYEYTDRL